MSQYVKTFGRLVLGVLASCWSPLASDTAVAQQARSQWDGVMRRAVQSLGQWNSIEIVARNNAVTAAVNGVVTTRISEHNYTEPGYIRFQTQGAKLYWRNIRIKPE
jgi:3-keto-disaccharide hydrolase